MRECSLASIVLVGLYGDESVVTSSFQYFLSVGKCCRGYENGTAVWKTNKIAILYSVHEHWSNFTVKSINILFNITLERKLSVIKRLVYIGSSL